MTIVQVAADSGVSMEYVQDMIRLQVIDGPSEGGFYDSDHIPEIISTLRRRWQRILDRIANKVFDRAEDFGGFEKPWSWSIPQATPIEPVEPMGTATAPQASRLWIGKVRY